MIRIVEPYKDDMIIPISVFALSGKVDICVYREYYDIALKYEAEFCRKGDPFSKDALAFLNDNIKPEGYVRYDEPDEFYYVYKMYDISELRAVADIKVVDIHEAEYDTDETEFEADIIKDNGEPASVIIENGRIAAISAANYFIEDDEDEVELAVETLPEFRGRGYARAVICDMVKKVFAMSKYPTYRVSCYNESSLKTVESCGFTLEGKEFYLNYYKEEE